MAAGDKDSTLPTSIGTANDGCGIADGNISAETKPPPKPDPKADRNYWVDNGDEWIFWKLIPTKGLATPKYGISKRPRDSGPPFGSLIGMRRTEAIYEDGTEDILEDSFVGDDAMEGKEIAKIRTRLRQRKWMGPTYFSKIANQQQAKHLCPTTPRVVALQAR